MATPLKAFDFRRQSTSSDLSFTRDSEASYYGSDSYLHFSSEGSSTPPKGDAEAPTDDDGQSSTGQNVLASSKDFMAKNWNKVGSTVTVQSNITAADGTSGASKITESTSKGEHRFSLGVTVQKGILATITIYVKAGTGNKIQFSFLGAGSFTGGNPGMKFNLSTGKLISKSTNVVSYEAIDAGNGWWQLKLSGLPNLGTSSGLHLYLLNDSNSINYQGASDKYAYACNAQILQGNSSAARVAAVTGLRFNNSLASSTPKLIGALIEPSGSNLVPYSQLLTHTAWRKQYATLITANGKAPDGTATVFKIKEDNSRNAQHYIMPYPTIPSTSGSTYTFSAFLKAAERKWAFFNLNGVTVHFDLVNGVVGNFNGIFIPAIENAGNGWFRCSATFKVTTSSTSAKIGPEPANGAPSYNGDSNSGIYVWGAQFEKSDQMTSYIRTQAAKVSRSVDKVTLIKPSASRSDIFLQRTKGGKWINNVTTNYEIPTSGDTVQLVNFYNADITASDKDETVESLFPNEYQSVGVNNTLVDIFDKVFMAQTPNKDWSMQRAMNKTSPIFRIQVKSGDTWTGDVSAAKKKERCELYMKRSDLPFDKDVWLSYAIKIAPGDRINNSSNDWCYLGQFHATEDKGDMATGPVLGFRLEGADTVSAYTASTLQNPIKIAPKYILRASGKFTRGVWHKVVVRMRFSPTKGQLQWWLNGKELVNVSGIGMGYPDLLGPYWKFGIYRSAMAPTLAIEVANMELEYNSSLLSRVTQPLEIA